MSRPWLPAELPSLWRRRAYQLPSSSSEAVANTLMRCADELQYAITYDDIKAQPNYDNPVLTGMGGVLAAHSQPAVTFTNSGYPYEFDAIRSIQQRSHERIQQIISQVWDVLNAGSCSGGSTCTASTHRSFCRVAQLKQNRARS